MNKSPFLFGYARVRDPLGFSWVCGLLLSALTNPSSLRRRSSLAEGCPLQGPLGRLVPLPAGGFLSVHFEHRLSFCRVCLLATVLLKLGNGTLLTLSA